MAWPGEEVLEIGTGYGQQAALLARLAAQVVSIEIWPDLAAQARRNLAAQAITNVLVVARDGTEGYPLVLPMTRSSSPRHSPRYRPHWPPSCPGGRLVQPIGPGGHEQVLVFERQAESLEPLRVLTSASFVLLTVSTASRPGRRDHGRHEGR